LDWDETGIGMRLGLGLEALVEDGLDLEWIGWSWNE